MGYDDTIAWRGDKRHSYFLWGIGSYAAALRWMEHMDKTWLMCSDRDDLGLAFSDLLGDKRLRDYAFIKFEDIPAALKELGAEE